MVQVCKLSDGLLGTAQPNSSFFSWDDDLSPESVHNDVGVCFSCGRVLDQHPDPDDDRGPCDTIAFRFYNDMVHWTKSGFLRALIGTLFFIGIVLDHGAMFVWNHPLLYGFLMLGFMPDLTMAQDPEGEVTAMLFDSLIFQTKLMGLFFIAMAVRRLQDSERRDPLTMFVGLILLLMLISIGSDIIGAPDYALVLRDTEFFQGLQFWASGGTLAPWLSLLVCNVFKFALYVAPMLYLRHYGVPLFPLIFLGCFTTVEAAQRVDLKPAAEPHFLWALGVFILGSLWSSIFTRENMISCMRFVFDLMKIPERRRREHFRYGPPRPYDIEGGYKGEFFSFLFPKPPPKPSKISEIKTLLNKAVDNDTLLAVTEQLIETVDYMEHLDDEFDWTILIRVLNLMFRVYEKPGDNVHVAAHYGSILVEALTMMVDSNRRHLSRHIVGLSSVLTGQADFESDEFVETLEAFERGASYLTNKEGFLGTFGMYRLLTILPTLVMCPITNPDDFDSVWALSVKKLKDSGTTLSGAVSSMFSWAKFAYLTVKTGSIKHAFEDLNEDLRKNVEACIQMNLMVEQGTYHERGIYIQSIYRQYSSTLTMISDAMSRATGRSEKLYLEIKQAKVQACLERLESRQRLGMAKVQPYVLTLVGDAGCGKSTMMPGIADWLHQVIGIDHIKEICTTNNGSKFRDEQFSTTTCLLSDDPANLKADKRDKTFVQENLEDVSTIVRPIEKSAVEEKGRHFTNHVFKVMSNNDETFQVAQETVNIDSALRRIGTVIKCRLLPKYSGGNPYTGTTGVDSAKALADEQRCAFSHTCEYGFVKLSSQGGNVIVKQPTTYYSDVDMLKLIRDDCLRHFDVSLKSLSRQISMTEFKMCPHKVPSKVCDQCKNHEPAITPPNVSGLLFDTKGGKLPKSVSDVLHLGDTKDPLYGISKVTTKIDENGNEVPSEIMAKLKDLHDTYAKLMEGDGKTTVKSDEKTAEFSFTGSLWGPIVPSREPTTTQSMFQRNSSWLASKLSKWGCPLLHEGAGYDMVWVRETWGWSFFRNFIGRHFLSQGAVLSMQFIVCLIWLVRDIMTYLFYLFSITTLYSMCQIDYRVQVDMEFTPWVQNGTSSLTHASDSMKLALFCLVWAFFSHFLLVHALYIFSVFAGLYNAYMIDAITGRFDYQINFDVLRRFKSVSAAFAICVGVVTLFSRTKSVDQLKERGEIPNTNGIKPVPQDPDDPFFDVSKAPPVKEGSYTLKVTASTGNRTVKYEDEVRKNSPERKPPDPNSAPFATKRPTRDRKEIIEKLPGDTKIHTAPTTIKDATEKVGEMGTHLKTMRERRQELNDDKIWKKLVQSLPTKLQGTATGTLKKDLLKAVEGNFFSMTISGNIGNSRGRAHAVALNDRCIVVVKHAVECALANGSTRVRIWLHRFKNKTTTEACEYFEVPADRIAFLPDESDMCIIPTSAVTDCVSLVKYLPIGKFTKPTEVTVVTSAGSNGETHPRKLVKYDRVIENCADPTYSVTINGEKKEYTGGAAYTYSRDHFDDGACMSVLVSERPQACIAGFHVAGSSTAPQSIAKPLTLEQYNSCLDILMTENIVAEPMSATAPQHVDYGDRTPLWDDALNPQNPLNFMANGNHAKYYASMEKVGRFRSALSISPAAALATNNTVADYKAFGYPGGNATKAMRQALVLSSDASIIPNRRVLKECKRDFMAGVDALVKDFVEEFGEVKALTTDQALNGSENLPFLEVLNTNTSAGVPFDCSKQKILKRIEREDGSVHWALEPDAAKLVQDAEFALQKGDRIGTPYKSFLKDEARDVDDPDPTILKGIPVGKMARTVNSSPLSNYLLARKYIGPIVSFMLVNSDHFETAIGEDALSPVFSDRILKMLNTNGDQSDPVVLELDFKNCDQSMDLNLRDFLISILLDIGKKLYKDEHEIRMLSRVLSDINVPLISFLGAVASTSGLFPSGVLITSIMDGMLGSLMMRASFFKRFPEMVDKITDDHSVFREYVRLITLGDDMWAVVDRNSTILETWNMKTIIIDADAMGLHLTGADKSDEVTDFIELSQSTFLRRTPWYNPDLGHIVFLLDPKSIFKPLLYYIPSSSISVSEQLSGVLVMLLQETFFSGREVYQNAVDFVQYVVMKLRLVPRKEYLRTYDEFKDAMLKTPKYQRFKSTPISDILRSGLSKMPHDYGFGDILFTDKGEPDVPYTRYIKGTETLLADYEFSEEHKAYLLEPLPLENLFLSYAEEMVNLADTDDIEEESNTSFFARWFSAKKTAPPTMVKDAVIQQAEEPKTGECELVGQSEQIEVEQGMSTYCFADDAVLVGQMNFATNDEVAETEAQTSLGDVVIPSSNLGAVLGRTFQVSTIMVKTGRLDVFEFYPYKLMAENALIRDLLIKSAYFKTDLKVSFVTSTSASVSGRLIMSFIPTPGISLFQNETTYSHFSIMLAQERLHVVHELGSDSTTELTIPFLSVDTAIRSINMEAEKLKNFGMIRVQPVSTIHHIQDVAVEVPMIVTIELVNPEQRGWSKLTGQMMAGLASAAVDSVSEAAAGAIENVVETGAQALADKTEAAISSAATDSLEAAREKVSSMIPLPIRSMIHAPEGNEMTLGLLGPGLADVEETPPVPGNNSLDYEKFLTMPVTIATAEWFGSNAGLTTSYPGQSLVRVGVTPATSIRMGNEYKLTPQALVSTQHKFWKGSLKYRVSVVTQSSVAGKLIMFYDPISCTASGGELSIQKNMHLIMDISKARVFEFTIPWSSNRHYLNTNGIIPFHPVKTWDNSTMVEVENSDYTNGQFTINVMVPLQGGGLAPPIATVIVDIVSADVQFGPYHPTGLDAMTIDFDPDLVGSGESVGDRFFDRLSNAFTGIWNGFRFAPPTSSSDVSSDTIGTGESMFVAPFKGENTFSELPSQSPSRVTLSPSVFELSEEPSTAPSTGTWIPSRLPTAIPSYGPTLDPSSAPSGDPCSDGRLLGGFQETLSSEMSWLVACDKGSYIIPSLDMTTWHWDIPAGVSVRIAVAIYPPRDDATRSNVFIETNRNDIIVDAVTPGVGVATRASLPYFEIGAAKALYTGDFPLVVVVEAYHSSGFKITGVRTPIPAGAYVFYTPQDLQTLFGGRVELRTHANGHQQPAYIVDSTEELNLSQISERSPQGSVLSVVGKMGWAQECGTSQYFETSYGSSIRTALVPHPAVFSPSADSYPVYLVGVFIPELVGQAYEPNQRSLSTPLMKANRQGNFSLKQNESLSVPLYPTPGDRSPLRLFNLLDLCHLSKTGSMNWIVTATSGIVELSWDNNSFSQNSEWSGERGFELIDTTINRIGTINVPFVSKFKYAFARGTIDLPEKLDGLRVTMRHGEGTIYLDWRLGSDFMWNNYMGSPILKRRAEGF